MENLNEMCLGCIHLNRACGGREETPSGCIWEKTDPEGMRAHREKVKILTENKQK